MLRLLDDHWFNGNRSAYIWRHRISLELVIAGCACLKRLDVISIEVKSKLIALQSNSTTYHGCL